ncbi:hypothetical protein PIB30_083814 [Stylosanthes scabra]|uniref:Uncharacterized protein n=1 Tax=Stylosanthes scabra TaxID=79078 RepID=A0ABU6YRB1_9FABA|nr:hypothetical protein [Stylosanthes scabra]
MLAITPSSWVSTSMRTRNSSNMGSLKISEIELSSRIKIVLPEFHRWCLPPSTLRRYRPPSPRHPAVSKAYRVSLFRIFFSVSSDANDKEKKVGMENKETEEEIEKQRKRTEEEEYKKKRKQSQEPPLGEHRSRLDQVTTWSKRDTHLKQGRSTHQAQTTFESRFGLAKT